MKIVVAPDKFKACFDAVTFCRIAKQAFADAFPEAELVLLPMADGGEGTVHALCSAGKGTLCTAEVTGPLPSMRVSAEFALLNHGRTAVLEMSSASGLALLPKDLQNPFETTTYGTGELMRAALDAGAEELLLGIGGSATVDGGAGMAAALGFALLDADGAEIPRKGLGLAALRRIDATSADPRLKHTSIRVASDVTSPLLGPSGATAVFAPQKGATPAMLPVLEENLRNLRNLCSNLLATSPVEMPGDGAAGGLGFGLRAFCGASLEPGAALVMDALHFEDTLRGADLLITGEGCTDAQTDAGKLCGELAKSARRLGVPVFLLSGALQGKPDYFLKTFDAAASIATGPGLLDDAIRQAEANLYLALVSTAKLLKLGGTPR